MSTEQQFFRRWGRCFGLPSLVLVCLVGFSSGDTAPAPLYAQNFEKVPEGDVPADILVLSGNFAVKKIEGNTLLELSPDVLDSDGILAGPADQATYSVSARIQATATGKRTPEFGVAANGPGQYRLWLMPAINQLQLIKGEEIKAIANYAWTSGSWTRFKLEVIKAADGKYKVRGRAWADGKDEPKDWMVTAEEAEVPQPGRACFYGTPYSGTPIRFDDIVVEATGK